MKTFKNSHNTLFTAQHTSGFTLIEVLIASLVLAGGITTFLMLQIQSLNNTRLAGVQTQANLLLSSIIDSARANIAGVELGAYDRAQAKARDLVEPVRECTPCSPNALATQDVNRWLDQVATQIPDSEIMLRYAAPEFHATITWLAREHEPAGVAISTRLCTPETTTEGASRCFR